MRCWRARLPAFRLPISPSRPSWSARSVFLMRRAIPMTGLSPSRWRLPRGMDRGLPRPTRSAAPLGGSPRRCSEAFWRRCEARRWIPARRCSLPIHLPTSGVLPISTRAAWSWWRWRGCAKSSGLRWPRGIPGRRSGRPSPRSRRHGCAGRWSVLNAWGR